MAQVDIAVQQGDEVVVADYTKSRFQLASVSKQFTAAALLLLVEEGTLLLEDPISRWIDGCPEQWRDISLHHLLSHTSGLGHWDDYPMIDLGQRVQPSELLKTFHSVPLQFPPGAGWRYSSPGYVLLAQIVQRSADTTRAARRSSGTFRNWTAGSWCSAIPRRPPPASWSRCSPDGGPGRDPPYEGCGGPVRR